MSTSESYNPFVFEDIEEVENSIVNAECKAHLLTSFTNLGKVILISFRLVKDWMVNA